MHLPSTTTVSGLRADIPLIVLVAAGPRQCTSGGGQYPADHLRGRGSLISVGSVQHSRAGTRRSPPSNECYGPTRRKKVLAGSLPCDWEKNVKKLAVAASPS